MGDERVAVVGGGIAGLAAALRLRERLGPGATITVFEQGAALGGKLRTGELAGAPQELGAETFLAGDPAGGESAAMSLARRVGLGGRLVHPGTTQAALVIGGSLTDIPAGTLMGVPDDPARVASVARVTAGRDADSGRPLLGDDEDVAIGALTRLRFGDEVVDRLVDPLLGGVYAGRADELSLEMTVPALARTARTEPTLARAVTAAKAASARARAAQASAGSAQSSGPIGGGQAESGPGPHGQNGAGAGTGGGAGAGAGAGTGGGAGTGAGGGAGAGGGGREQGGPGARAAGAPPVFATIDGGLSRLVEAVAAAAGAEVRLGLPVRALERAGDHGWILTVGAANAADAGERLRFDAVVLALPAKPAARLLKEVEPGVAQVIGGLDYASLALVNLALPAAELPGLSGLLVPPVEGLLIKAATFFGVKWPHLRRADGVVHVRASIGRYREEHLLHRDDVELAGAAHAELSALLGTPLPRPVDTIVQRWGGALPQYTPGHRQRIASARELLRASHPTLVLAGAGFDGVGIPLCVRSGETAGDEVADEVRRRRQV
ncbi:protoporphyrinogen oxidase [Catenuloplanes sp. NPDC051500]|uniref:protoporphyrinogen oxidase n=1 Tax=Catenuloplanes sp. NPDC051500 TaxID=3363959 RepID=UPI0037AD7CC5